MQFQFDVETQCHETVGLDDNTDKWVLYACYYYYPGA